MEGLIPLAGIQQWQREPVRIGDTTVHAFRAMHEIVAAVFPPAGGVSAGFGIAINPEKIVEARRNAELRRVLATSTIRFADGIGVVWALRRRKVQADRIAGVDLWYALMAEAARTGRSVYLLGGQPDVIVEARRRLRTEFASIRIVGARHGYFDSQAAEQEVAEEIEYLRPDLVTVAMGSPRQEEVIARLRRCHADAFYLGVGGTYDVYTGRVRRAPRIFQKSGLEWMFRLMQDPRRAKRQVRLLKFVALELAGRL